MADKRGSYDMGKSEQDLVDDSPSRPHRHVFMGIGAVLVLAAIVIACVILISQTSSSSSSLSSAQPESVTRQLRRNSSAITLDEVLTVQFAADAFLGHWISDNEYLDESKNGLFIFNVDTSVKTLLIEGPDWAKLTSFRSTVSDSRKYVLCPHQAKQVYRHSKIAKYDIYDVKNKKRIKLTNGASEDYAHRLLEYATWVPERDSVVFVFGNNIYIRPSMSSSRVVQLTKTGVRRVIYNGVPDWVYEEEVVGKDNTIWFSKDGRMLAYASYNDTRVDIMPIQVYGFSGKLEYQYPISHKLRYPKTGRENPTVSVYVVDLDRAVANKPPMKVVSPPSELQDKVHYLTRVGWVDNASLTLTWMNRHQNRTIITLFNATKSTNQQSKILDHVSPDHTWNDIEESPVWYKDLSFYITLLPKLEGAGDHFKHIHVVWPESMTRMPLTSGNLTVTEILHWDQERHKIYFMGVPLENASERHLYTVTDIKSPGPSHVITCLTCGKQSDASGHRQPCLRNSFDFSVGGGYYVWTCEGPRLVPRITMHRTVTGKQIRLVADNAELRDRLASKVLPTVENITMDLGNGFSARIRVKLPPGLDKNSRHKYPMLVYTYGGPNSQVIGDSWGIAWEDHLTTEREIVHVAIDARGSGYRGDSLLHTIYYNMGTVEVQDQITAARGLLKLYDFIDPSRTAIWGWSYGGYVTSRAMAIDEQDVFKCGIAVAPVTNWIYYDTIYTERYMGLPTEDDNARGYAAGDVSSNVENFRDKKFLLVHGVADDNVHAQQSMMLSRALEKADILFRQQFYPDENHGLSGIRRHHYHTMERFLEDCFSLPHMKFAPPQKKTENGV